MRKRAFLTASLVLLVAAGCGGGGQAINVPPMTAAKILRHPVVGSVEIYFCNAVSMPECHHADATPDDERAARVLVGKESCVGQIVFISKADALRWLKKTEPPLVGVPGMANPLPDAYVVIPQNTSCTDTLAKDVKAAHLSGVQTVKTITGRPK